MLASKRDHLSDFRCSDVGRIQSANTATFRMNFEHNLRRLFMRFVKKMLHDMHNKIHRRVIVVK